MTYFFKNFTRFMKSEKERLNHESKKKMKDFQRAQISKEKRHVKYDCPRSNKKGSSSKKAYVATWSDEENFTDNEVANLCLMALQEGEVTSNSSISNSYTFDELQDVCDELIFEFKVSISKNKKLISKLKIENELLLNTNLEVEAKFKEFELKVFYLQNLLQNLEKDHQKEVDDLKKEKIFDFPRN
ncbi:hypothetical protein GQ457_02G028440 [Hibiscus cannabinus]